MLYCHFGFCYHLAMSQDTHIKFICPNDGEISQDDVIFLCNVCNQDDVILKDGVYMCPSCLNPGENFQCMLCDSKEVKMVTSTKNAES